MNETDFDSKARERYRRRGFFGNPDTPKKVVLNELAHRLTPSIGDFALMFICGVVTGLTIWFDLPPLLLIVFAVFPFLGSFFGFLIGLTTGSFGFAAKALVNFLITGISYFLGAFIVGYAAGGRFTLEDSFLQNALHPSSVLLFVGAISTIFALLRLVTRQDELPEKFSTAAFTAAWIPLGLAGFLLGTGAALPFATALRTSLLGLSVNILISIAGLYLLRVFTAKLSAYILSFVLFLFSGLFTFVWRGVIAADAGKIIAAIQARISGSSAEITPSDVPTAATQSPTEPTAIGIALTASPLSGTPTAIDIAGIETLEIDSEPHATLEPPAATADEASAELTVVSVKEKLGIFANAGVSTPDAPTAVPTITPTRTPIPSKTAAPTRTAAPTSTHTAAPSATLKPTQTALPSATPLPPTKPFVPTLTPTASLTRTLPPEPTASATMTATASVNYATVKVEGDVGVLVRVNPEFNATVMKSVLNDSAIELTGKRIERPLQNVTWVEVRINDGLTGWVQAAHLVFHDDTAPSATPTSTATEISAALLPTEEPTLAPTKGYVPTVTPTLASVKTETTIPVKAAATATATSAAAMTASPEHEPSATIESAPAVASATIVTVQNPSDVGSLLRLSPEFNSVIMKSLMNGTTLELVGEERKVPYQDFTWVRVRTVEGYVGWVGKNHLVYPDSAVAEEVPTAATEVKPLAAATLTPSITPATVARGATVVPTPVSTSAATVTAMPKPTATASDTETARTGLYAVVAATTDVGVLVRVSPEKNAVIMKSVLNGSTLEIVETRGKTNKPANWVQVRTGDGYVGWVRIESLIMPNMPTPTITPTPTPFVHLTFGPPVYYAVVHAANQSGVYLRSDPQADATVQNAVLNGSLVELVGIERSGSDPNSDWVKIRTNEGTVGWVGKETLIYPEK